jgi:hypothetical protein
VEGLWAISQDCLIEHGDAFVGITHHPAAADGICSRSSCNAA